MDGPPPAGPTAKRTVGFFNHTDRDLKLTVEGDTVTLPRRHYVTAEVPATFGWKLDGDERRTEVPAAAPGVEVVIRKGNNHRDTEAQRRQKTEIRRCRPVSAFNSVFLSSLCLCASAVSSS